VILIGVELFQLNFTLIRLYFQEQWGLFCFTLHVDNWKAKRAHSIRSVVTKLIIRIQFLAVQGFILQLWEAHRQSKCHSPLLPISNNFRLCGKGEEGELSW
jgi:hypothetical protein